MAKAKPKAKREAYIETRPGVRGGAPVIAGTGIKVLDVAVRYEIMGMTHEGNIVALPHLTLPQIHAALSYYYAQKAEIDKEWKTSLKKISRLRARHPSARFGGGTKNRVRDRARERQSSQEHRRTTS